jgi:hypothetical protein
MEVTQRVIAVNRARGPGRIEFRADDPTLTPYAGLAISGELCRHLRLVAVIDAELEAARAAPVKRRRRGSRPGSLRSRSPRRSWRALSASTTSR